MSYIRRLYCNLRGSHRYPGPWAVFRSQDLSAETLDELVACQRHCECGHCCYDVRPIRDLLVPELVEALEKQARMTAHANCKPGTVCYGSHISRCPVQDEAMVAGEVEAE